MKTMKNPLWKNMGIFQPQAIDKAITAIYFIQKEKYTLHFIFCSFRCWNENESCSYSSLFFGCCCFFFVWVTAADAPISVTILCCFSSLFRIVNVSLVWILVHRFRMLVIILFYFVFSSFYFHMLKLSIIIRLLLSFLMILTDTSFTICTIILKRFIKYNQRQLNL